MPISLLQRVAPAAPATPIAFIDLAAQQARLRPQIDAAIARVLAHGQYVMGSRGLRAFEHQLAAFAGAAHAVSCANGTEAVALPLMAWEIGPGDAVFCSQLHLRRHGRGHPLAGRLAGPSSTSAPTPTSPDPERLEAAILAIQAEGKLTPCAILAVDLFGQPADYPAIAAVARKYGLKLIADSAPAYGATLNGLHPAHWADAMTTSFFPAKPLGAYGDGGAVLTDDDWLAERIDSLRVHGKATKSDLEGHCFDHDPKYLNLRVGMNSRLDTLQAAILIEKLKVFRRR